MKKRILSLILALSMVLSVLPLGAFAEGSTGDLVMKGGFPKDSNYGSNSCSGTGWSYETSTGTLYLNSGTYNFSLANPQDTTKKTPANSAVQCAIQLDGSVEITGGNFEANVTNNAGGIISDAIFNREVTNGGTIKNSIFAYSVTNYSYIENGTFNGSVTNNGTNATIKNGTFEKEVTNNNRGEISGGAFNKKVSNINGKISNGIFMGDVTNDSDGHILRGTFAGKVTNYGNINSKGTFNGTVENYGGTISSGTFKGTVENWNGTISGGIFHEKVSNSNGEITGGTFAAGLSANHNTVTGGAFNGNTGLTGAFHVTVTNGSVDKVNGVVTTGTAWDLYAYEGTTMTITASTDIYSLNDQPIVDGNCKSSYDGSNKTIVKFTMPNRNVELGTGELVMAGGYPVGTIGNGWKYSDSTLTLTRGTFDFSSTHPQGKTPGTPTTTPVACAIEIQSGVEITGGTFKKKVVNNANGTISDGTFKGDVTNYSSGTISGGTFAGSVDNRSGTVTGGVFNLKANPTNVTGYAIKWDDAYSNANPNAKIVAVNDVSAEWDPCVVIESGKTKEVTITADTEIFSLNGKSLDESNYPNTTDKKTVTFTMPGENVVLNWKLWAAKSKAARRPKAAVVCSSAARWK